MLSNPQQEITIEEKGINNGKVQGLCITAGQQQLQINCLLWRKKDACSQGQDVVQL